MCDWSEYGRKENYQLRKQKRETKQSGRFKITIETFAPKNSLYVTFEITIEDFKDSPNVLIKRFKYQGSEPEKEAEKIVHQIKAKEEAIFETKVFYMD